LLRSVSVLADWRGGLDLGRLDLDVFAPVPGPLDLPCCVRVCKERKECAKKLLLPHLVQVLLVLVKPKLAFFELDVRRQLDGFEVELRSCLFVKCPVKC
jgi:hypothetical protein